MTTSRYLALYVILITGLCYITNSSYGQSKEDLSQLVEAYRNQISDIDFTMISRMETLAIDPTRKGKSIPKMDIHIRYKGNKQFIEYEAWKNENTEQPKHDLRVYNGEISVQYNKYYQSGSITPGRDRAVGMHNPIYGFQKWPTSPSERLNVYMDLPEFIKSDRCKILPNREMVHGVECVVIERDNGKEKIWLDIVHGGIIRKSELHYGTADGPLIWRYDFTELHEMNGVYFPAKAIKTRFANHTNPEEMWNTAIWQATITVPKDKVKINSGLTDKDFEFEFPPGTTVHDMIAGRSYTVGAPSDTRGKAPLDDMSDVDAAPRPRDESRNYSAWMFIAIGLSIILVLWIYVKTRKKAKQEHPSV